MNFIWSGMILISIISAILTGRVDETINAIFEGASTAVSTLISLAGAICFWTGIMKIAEKSGVSSAICKLISPAVKRLFPSASQKTREYISMNITANFLGMGNAATPMGILAAETLDAENHGYSVPSRDMCMLVTLNTTSLQILPTTILAMRSAAGSQNPMSVILPIWIVSAFSMAVGITAVFLTHRFFPNKINTA